MAFQTYDWEMPLLAMARDRADGSGLYSGASYADRELLDQAYAYCETVTAEHSRSFSLASRLLPYDKRRAIRALYAFCRTTDDIVDHRGGDSRAALARWRERVLGWEQPQDDPVAVAWADTRARHQIPTQYIAQLIDGVERDLYQSRYETFEELAVYCYGVASTVGLMSMHIIGFQNEDAIPYAVRLGVALQLTNILRDVGEDWQCGRLYLPLEELEAFGLTEADIANAKVDARWRDFMEFQIGRTCRLYAEAWPGVSMLAPRGRLAIAAAADFYSAILAAIKAIDYDVFGQRAHLSGWGKLRRVPGLWRRTRHFDHRLLQKLAPHHTWTPCSD